MKKIIIHISLLLFIFELAGSQTLRVVRTDVDSSRAGTITSGKPFGFDIYLDSVQNCSVVSFELNYNRANFIKFSQINVTDFGSSKSLFSNTPKATSTLTEEKMTVAIFSGLPANLPNQYDNPRILHLEFVALPTTPNGSIVTFEFKNARATYFDESSDSTKEVGISSEALKYDVFGYVDVWPGDANNDGIVNSLDHSKIGLLLGIGSQTPNHRSFKRKSPSTMFYGQRVLLWDNKEATYADCDGDGDVSIGDGMVVFFNDAKSKSEIKDNTNQIQSPKFDEENFDNNILVPIYISSTSIIQSAAISLDITDIKKNFDIVGVKSGKLFEQKNINIIHHEINNEFNFLIGTYSKEQSPIGEGIIAYLALSAKGTLNNIISNLEIIKANGMTLSGEIVNLNTGFSTDIESEEYSPTVEQNGEILNININENSVLNIYNLSGEKIIENNLNLGNNLINISALQNGIYFINISNAKINFSEKLIILK